MAPSLTLITLAAASPALAGPTATASRHDGTWDVTTSAERGTCDTNFDFKPRMKGGKVTSAGFWPVKASGGICKPGVVNMTLSHGHQRVVAKGRVAGDAASADWTTPKPKCSGAWFARRA